MRKPLILTAISTFLNLFLLCLTFYFSTWGPALAQEGQKQFQKAELLVSASAPVIVDGKELFRVGGITAYPAAERAKNIAQRIKDLAADHNVSPKDIVVSREKDLTLIKTDTTLIMGLVESDAVREGLSVEVLTELAKEKIVNAIIEYRNDRTPKTLWTKSGYALIATLLTGLLLWGIIRLFGWGGLLAQKRMKTRIKSLESKSHSIIQADQILDIVGGLLSTLKVLTILAVIYFYLNLVLGLYPWTRSFAKYLFSLTIDPLRVIGLGLVNALPNIFFLIIFFFLIRYVLKMTRLFFTGIERGRIRLANFDREWSRPTYKIVRLLIISFAVVVAYPYIPGSSSDAFKSVSIFLGVIFSLGSSSIIANIIAGYTITYRRPFKIGDRIQIENLTGDVIDRTTLATRLLSLKNEEIVIPNSVVLKSHVINYTTEVNSKGLILHTSVSIGYEVPWRQVEAMLLLAAERTKGINSKPKPFILQKSLGAFAVSYELNVYCKDASSMMELYSELHRNILDVFNEYNVQIMTPNYERDTTEPKVVPKERWYEPPAEKMK
jgi:small-conductance mechanosensitive channel